MGKGQELYSKAKTMIPGGTQLLSKRPEMFLPGLWPAYYSKAKGCKVWDLDGNEYTDVSYMGIGTSLLGYCDDDVDAAVVDAISRGNMTTLNAPEEVELAELLLSIHSWASHVRFARSGGEAMALAVRIARAYSRKDTVLFSGYHGWHDWYLAANLAEDSALDGHLLSGLEPAGVPRGLVNTAIPFRYNDSSEFLKLFEKNKDRVGAIVLESIRNEEPEEEFVQQINNISKEFNIPLIVDEITSGFRLNTGGAHLLYNLKPDIAVFAKAISNGYPMAAIIGKQKIMDAAQKTFISSTYWTDRVGPSAAIATIKKMMLLNVQEEVTNRGKRVQQEWKKLGAKNNLDIQVGGIYPLSHFTFSDKHLVNKTLYTQFMLERGYLATTAFYISYAHTDDIISQYLKDTDEVFGIIADAARKGESEKLLKTEVCHSGFQRLN